jgi:ferredoxin--NADP+ reductase
MGRNTDDSGSGGFDVRVADAIAATHLVAEITQRRDLGPDLWILRIRPEERLEFRPGQFATLGVPDGEKPLERPYSIASSPLETDLEFFLERVPGGELSRRLHGLEPSDPLLVRRAAKGNFTFDDASGHRTHLMVATVTGVAPFVSMVRTLRQEERRGKPTNHRVFLLQGASRSWELGYDRELVETEKETSWFRYVPTVSRPAEDPGWRGDPGRVHDHILRSLGRFACDPAQTTAYLCGHPGMIEAAEEILRPAGFDRDSIRKERYWVAS